MAMKSSLLTLAVRYEFPAAFVVDMSCFGLTETVDVAGRSGKLMLPEVRWREDEKSPFVSTPDLSALPELARERLLAGRGSDDPLWWGSASRSATDRSWAIADVYAALIIFEQISQDEIAYSEYLHGLGSPSGALIDEIYEALPVWFSKLADWARVLTGQHVNAAVQAGQAQVHGDGIRVLSVGEAGETSLMTGSNRISVRMPGSECLTVEQFRRINRDIQNGVEPPTEHLLVAGARQALVLGRYRTAVIDAATALELTCVQAFHSSIAMLPSGIQTGLRAERRTLGPLVDLLATCAPIPSGTKEGVVALRNKVIHKNYTPMRGEAANAVDLAASFVKQIYPIS